MSNLVPLRTNFFSPLEQQFDQFFRDFFQSPKTLNGVKNHVSYPKLDVYEDEQHLVVEATIPGMNPEDVTAELQPDNILEIRGEKIEQSESSKWHVKEIRKSSFSRQIRLPDWVEGDPQQATAKNGLLTLKWDLPDAKPPTTIKKIQFKVE